MSLSGGKITVGLTGGIACYKIPYLVRLLVKAGAEVQVIMTSAATRFITPLTLETVSNRPVAVQMFTDTEYVATRHIDLAHWSDLMVVAPATANFLGKAAGGISDDLLTTVVCATPVSVLIAPAMNPNMWSNKVTQRNYALLKKLGYLFVGPVEGEVVSEDVGVGRMAEPDQIFDAIKSHLERPKKKALTGKKIVVTAGPSREAIDPVRYLSNRSSGKMGYSLAEAALALGADVTLISGPTSLTPPPGARLIRFESTDQLCRAVESVFKDADCLLMAAAPADFKPATTAGQKIKKGRAVVDLALEPTVDVLKKTGAGKAKGQLAVGFALETESGLANARKKLKEKRLDMIVLNKVGEHTGFDSDTNQVTILLPRKRPEVWPLMDKTRIACKLLEMLAPML